METFPITSISKEKCQSTNEDIIRSLESCRDCGEIPIPSYKSSKDKSNSYCKECYLTNKFDVESLIYPNKLELIAIGKLKINCNQVEKGCKETFNIKTIDDLLDHEKKCSNSRTILHYKEIFTFPAEDSIKYCKRCKVSYLGIHDCLSHFNTNINNLKSICETIENKLFRMNEKFMEKFENLSKKIDTISFNLEEKVSLIWGKFEKESHSNLINTERQLDENQKKQSELLSVIKEDIYMKVRSSLNDMVNENIQKIIGQINETFKYNLQMNNSNTLEESVLEENFSILNNSFQETNDLKQPKFEGITKFQAVNHSYLGKNYKEKNLDQNNIILSKQTKPKYNCIRLGKHNHNIWCLIKLSDNLFMSGSEDKSFKLWDFVSKKCLMSVNCNSTVYSITKISEDLVAIGAGDGILRIWNFKTGIYVKQIPGHKYSIWCVIKLSKGRIATGSNDYSIKIWDSIRFELIKELNAHYSCVRSICELSDGRIVSCSWDKTIKIWNNYQCIDTITGHNSDIWSVIEISDDTIASSSCDKSVKIWRVKNKECIMNLFGHNDSVYCLVLLNNGKLASASGDKTIRIWDLQYKKCIQILSGHSSSIYSLIELSDGKLASGGKDYSILVWN